MNQELYHYGIKGQKWGVLNGPPYPIGSESRSTKRTNRLSNSHNGKSSKRSSIRESSEDNKKRKKFRLSDKQKKALKIGAAIAGTALVAYGAYKLNKTYGISGIAKKALSSFNDIVKPKAEEHLVHWADTWSMLSKEERNAAVYYTNQSGCDLIQSVLRGDREDAYGMSIAKTLHDGIAKCKLSDDITTYRYTDFNYLIHCIGLNKLQSAKKLTDIVGEEFTVPAFYSSSISETSTSGWGNVKFTTICKKGTEALFIGDNSEHPFERELLLNSGTSFVIRDVKRTLGSSGKDILEIFVETIVK